MADPLDLAFPLFSDLVRRIEALGFTPGSENPLGWVVVEAERLRTENQRLQTAISPAAVAVAVDEAVAERDAAFTQGVRRGLEAAAAWVDGDNNFDPLIPLTKHMNVGALSHDALMQIEGITDAVLAGAAEAIRKIDPSTVKP